MVLDYVLGEVRAPTAKLEHHRCPRKVVALQSNRKQAWGKSENTCLPCQKSSISPLGYTRRPFLPPRISRCGLRSKIVIGYGTGNLPTQARSSMVDLRPLRAQRLPHMETHRERLPSLRLKRLRLGSSAQRLRRSTGVLDSPGSTQHITFKELKAV